MPLHYTKSLCWFRRDLRLDDHAALYHALRSSNSVICVFVFDKDILAPLPRADRRVEFIWQSVNALKAELQARGSDLLVRTGTAVQEIARLVAETGVEAVFTNHDYEPSAIKRDAAVAEVLTRQSAALHTFKDLVIFERDEVLTAEGKPFTVFTPYKNAWLKKLSPFYVQAYPCHRHTHKLQPRHPEPMPTLDDLGFQQTNLLQLGVQPGTLGAEAAFADFCGRMDRYHLTRDFPGVKGVSYLSVHLRFGTISIRQLAAYAWHIGSEGAMTWLNELIWRDFYHQVLFHRPDVESHAFKPEYNDIAFPNDQTLFDAWREGRTGYPLVDAAMRQLNHSGYMHNRLRMIAASFLVKDLLIDWRWGERYFAEKLLDYDLAANNGGWQWAASTGCDAQPYFRIFNPVTQSKRFDPDGKFIRRYVPELQGLSNDAIHAPWIRSKGQPPVDSTSPLAETAYPSPVVDHAIQRSRALALFKRH